MSSDNKMMEITPLPTEPKRKRLPAFFMISRQLANHVLNGMFSFLRLTEKEQEDAGIYPGYQSYK
jgi:hypothetical protein